MQAHTRNGAGDDGLATSRVGRGNGSLALALVCFALSFLFIFDADGAVWMMWRDAPLVATGFVLAAAFFAVRWRRTRH